jgi:hypothetical protein
MVYNNVIPTSKRIERLQYENPWWLSGEIQKTYQEISKILYFDFKLSYIINIIIK